jgi:predicted nucleic-acid-binding Zn-ribbon protein
MGTSIAWKCTKCGNTTMGINKPLASVCGRGGNHTWTKAGAPGTMFTWRCSKCGNTTTGSTHPMDRPCGRGGKCSWSKHH